MADPADVIAADMWRTARSTEQCTRSVADDELAARVRAEVRALAATDGIGVRTARIDGAVVVVRVDAAVWSEDAATMRAKLELD